jgi:hypothetical protein
MNCGDAGEKRPKIITKNRIHQIIFHPHSLHRKKKSKALNKPSNFSYNLVASNWCTYNLVWATKADNLKVATKADNVKVVPVLHKYNG